MQDYWRVIVRYGRKGNDHEREMDKNEFNKLLNILKILGYDTFIEIF